MLNEALFPSFPSVIQPQTPQPDACIELSFDKAKDRLTSAGNMINPRLSALNALDGLKLLDEP